MNYVIAPNKPTFCRDVCINKMIQLVSWTAKVLIKSFLEKQIAKSFILIWSLFKTHDN